MCREDRGYYGLKSPPYKLGALELYLSQRTLDVHWGGHHHAYVESLCKQLVKNDALYGYTMDELIRVTYNNGNPLPEFNNAAQVWNHDFFWESMQPGGGDMPTLGILQQIEKDFASFANFKEKFIEAALTSFGSGWVWLVLKREMKCLAIVKTTNAVNPLVWNDIPIINLDLWEHACYLDYKNDRAKYVNTFMNHLVSWNAAAAQMAHAQAFVNLGEPKIPVAKNTFSLCCLTFPSSLPPLRIMDENLQREIINHTSLRHPNIVRFKEAILTPNLAIMMEYASGGELFEHICNVGRFNEDGVLLYFLYIFVLWLSLLPFLVFTALHVLVSPAGSFLFLTTHMWSELLLLMVSNFSPLSLSLFAALHVLVSPGGSFLFLTTHMWSELLLLMIADVWSCGVHYVLCWLVPIRSRILKPKDFRKTIQRIRNVHYSIPEQIKTSKECQSLISRIYVADSAQQITMPEIANHVQFLKNLPADLMDGRGMGNKFEEPEQPSCR